MKINNLYSHDKIVAVPTTEIARWNARIGRTNFALSQNTTILRGGGMADDGMVVYEVGRKMLDGAAWQAGPDYEDAVIYALKPGIDAQKVEEGLRESPFMSTVSSTAASEYVGHTALREGLGRLDIISSEPSGAEPVPVGAVAALCFGRADIHQKVDRHLWDRHVDIRNAERTIAAAVRPRQASTEQGDGYSTYAVVGWGEDYAKMTSGIPDGRKAWWNELENDLLMIDYAAGRLAVGETLD